MEITGPCLQILIQVSLLFCKQLYKIRSVMHWAQEAEVQNRQHNMGFNKITMSKVTIKFKRQLFHQNCIQEFIYLTVTSPSTNQDSPILIPIPFSESYMQFRLNSLLNSMTSFIFDLCVIKCLNLRITHFSENSLFSLRLASMSYL